MEAKTIEDRAKEYADGVYSKYSNKHVMNIGYNGYYSGAIEQKQIDIDKACEWIKNNMAHFWHSDEDGIVSNFRKAMEE